MDTELFLILEKLATAFIVIAIPWTLYSVYKAAQGSFISILIQSAGLLIFAISVWVFHKQAGSNGSDFGRLADAIIVVGSFGIWAMLTIVAIFIYLGRKLLGRCRQSHELKENRKCPSS